MNHLELPLRYPVACYGEVHYICLCGTVESIRNKCFVNAYYMIYIVNGINTIVMIITITINVFKSVVFLCQRV